MQNYSKKIINLLSQKKAVSLTEINTLVKDGPSQEYAITRSLKNLKNTGLVEHISSGQNDYARLTKEGKKKMHSLKLENDTTLVNTKWDGFWRIILLDLPESRKAERESLRYLLKKADFACIKNSVWVSPLPYENLFANIKKDLGLTTEMMIIVSDKLDDETTKAFFEVIKNQ